MTAIKREERIGGQRLILGDCLEVMPELERFDAVVWDPPWGIGFSEYTAHDDKESEYPEWIASALGQIPTDNRRARRSAQGDGVNDDKTEIPRTDTWQSIGSIAARLVEKAKQERGK